MGVLQTAYRTYEAQAHRAGVVEEKEKEPLTPLAHAIQNAHLEITINTQGLFQKAAPVPKDQCKTVIPVTIESANRTGDNTKAHPLCDQLRYLAPFGGEKFAAYLLQLTRWAQSEFTHPKPQAVLAYIRGKSIVADLAASGVITLDEEGNPGQGKIEGIEYGKCLVRWIVTPAPDGVQVACWQDPTLFERYTAFYASQPAADRDLCFIAGVKDEVCEVHPKGVIGVSFGAKLVSSNDPGGFTYRGRFADARQACSIGYTASQKAHHALRWVASNQGVTYGGRTFLCWNPEGAPVPILGIFGMANPEEPVDFVAYRKRLRKTLDGYRQTLPETSDVVIAALDAATTGRLSVTYYNELKASDFLDRIQGWYDSICWETRYGVQAPPLKRIVDCAFGTQRSAFIEADEKILSEHIQRLFHCMLDQQLIPADMVRALAARASTPLAYKPANREVLLATACAVIRKYRNDKFKEGWTLALDLNNDNRSYLFGRLLAVAELVERSTYDREEAREPNAIRMKSVYAQRPLYAWRILEDKLDPYFARLSPGLRAYYKKIIGEIVDALPGPQDPELGKRLEDTYLLGYYHQRSAMTRKKEKTMQEDGNDGNTEE